MTHIEESTEYITDIVSTGSATTPFSLGVNPGDPTTYTNLLNIAQCFEKYRFLKIWLMFVTDLGSSTAVAGSTGDFLMCSQQNVGATPYISRVQLENSGTQKVDSVSKSFKLDVPCKFTEEWYYVRSGDAAVTTNTPLNLLDCCRLYYCINSSLPSGTILGKLYIKYSVKFSSPRNSLARYGYTRLSQSVSSSTSINLGTVVLSASKYGVTQTVSTTSSVLLGFSDALAGESYLVIINANFGTSTVTTPFAVGTTVGFSPLITMFNAQASNTITYPAAGSAAQSRCGIMFAVTATSSSNTLTGNSITITAGVLAGAAASNTDILVICLGSGMATF